MKRELSERELLGEISAKLDSIVGMIATYDLKGDVGKIVDRLMALRLPSSVVAGVAGISENALSIRLSRMRKKGSARLR